MARSLRYDSFPCISVGGVSPESANAPTSVGEPPDFRAFSASAALTGVDPMFTIPMPGLSPACSAQPTIAQSWARRLNFWYAQLSPVCLGTRISVRSSSSLTSVSQKSVKKASDSTFLSPEGPEMTSVARVARIAAGRSEAGSP